MSSCDLLAVSPSACTAVNRAVYRRLVARGVRVSLVAPEELWSGSFRKACDPARPGDPDLLVLRLRGRGPRSHRYAGLARACLSAKPRAILAEYDPGSLVSVELAAVGRALGARVACQTCENLPRSPLADFRARRWSRAVSSLGVRTFTAAAALGLDRVFVISDDGARVMDRVGFRGRVTKIPLGFDEELFRPDDDARARVRARLELAAPVVAYFGRLTPEKGVHLLVDALATLRSERWQLLLDSFAAYQSPYAAELEARIADRGIADRVVTFDAGHDEMPEYMNAADIVVLPSVSTPTWIEQYGRVAPEAMACGRAVVVSHTGALPELVGDAGVTVPEGDVAALAEALRGLLADPGRRDELGQRASERARAELGIGRQAEMLAEWLAAAGRCPAQ